MNVNLFKPYGFCSGVTRSIEIALRARKENKNASVFVFGMLVHNESVINMLKEHDIYMINDLNELKEGDIVVLNAHGSKDEVYKFLNKKQIKFYDTTCPIVNSINDIVRKNIDKDIIYVGISNHSESNTTLSLSDKIYLFDINNPTFDYSKINDIEPLILRQSTISDLDFYDVLDEIRKHCKNVKVMNCVCPFVKERQDYVNEIDNGLIVIIGSNTSNNAKSLLKLAKDKNSVIVNSLEEIKKVDTSKFDSINIISSTSAPNELVESIFNYLKSN